MPVTNYKIVYKGREALLMGDGGEQLGVYGLGADGNLGFQPFSAEIDPAFSALPAEDETSIWEALRKRMTEWWVVKSSSGDYVSGHAYGVRLPYRFSSERGAMDIAAIQNVGGQDTYSVIPCDLSHNETLPSGYESSQPPPVKY